MEIGYNSRNELVFKNKENNKTYRGENIIYIPNLAWDGVKALLVPDVHRDNFGLALANRNYGANFYKNGAHLNGVLKHPGRLTNEAYDRLKGSFNRAFGGSQNAGGTAILELLQHLNNLATLLQLVMLELWHLSTALVSILQKQLA